jgi:hypothetical protein
MDTPKHSDQPSREHPAMTFEEAAKQEATVTFSTREILHKIGSTSGGTPVIVSDLLFSHLPS